MRRRASSTSQVVTIARALANAGSSARQLVILGAGLDGRAFRLGDVGDSPVFESTILPHRR